MNEYDQRWCQNVHKTLMSWSICEPFKKPVTDGEAKNYSATIKTPMDLGTVKKKLTNKEYTTVDQFISDIRLICENAKKFNGENSLFWLICTDIENELNEWIKCKGNSEEEAWYINLEKASRLLREHIVDAPSSITFVKEALLPRGFDDSLVDAERLEKIKPLTGEFDASNLVNVWAFIDHNKREEILKILEGLEIPEKETSGSSDGSSSSEGDNSSSTSSSGGSSSDSSSSSDGSSSDSSSTDADNK